MTAATPFSPSFSSKNSLILSPRHNIKSSQPYNSPRTHFYGISCTEKEYSYHLCLHGHVPTSPISILMSQYNIFSFQQAFILLHCALHFLHPKTLSLSKALLPHHCHLFFFSLSIFISGTKILSLEEEEEEEGGEGGMSVNKAAFLNEQLSKRTSIFGLRLWVVLGVCVGAAFVLLLFLISLWFISKRNKSSQNNSTKKPTIPNVSKEIQEIRVVDHHVRNSTHHHQDFKSNHHHQTQVSLNPLPESDHPINQTEHQALLLHPEEDNLSGLQRIHIEIGKDHRISYPGSGGGVGGGGGGGVGGGSSHGSGETRSVDQIPVGIPEVSHLGWGHWYTLRELEASTDGFADENVIGEGGYGIVYRGLLVDNTHVAIKNLLNNRGQAEKEFKVEVEAIGRVRHKNLVRLLGYCAEGAHRMLVYEYVDNGNLEQWLHGDVGPVSPLTWDIRTNIILGTAKGLTYLHEGLEPKVVHRDVKSSNILLDRQWNPKVSDFGLAKLLGSESSYVTTRVMGTFGYVAPEYASTGMLNERSDVYSFGILIMEIISGRSPVDYSRPPGEVNLVEWLKSMVSNRNAEGVLDPKIPEKPSSRALKRALLVALKCVDPDAPKRPKMGHVIHMLEADDFPYRDERRNNGRDPGRVQHDNLKRVSESGDSSGCESGTQVNRTGLRKPESSKEHLVDEKLK